MTGRRTTHYNSVLQLLARYLQLTLSTVLRWIAHPGRIFCVLFGGDTSECLMDYVAVSAVTSKSRGGQS